MNTNLFENRHIGPDNKEIEKMLSTVKVETLDQLISETVPVTSI
jgi:glycine dehydrogenase